MSVLTWEVVITLVKKYWWMLLVLVAVIYILILRLDLAHKDNVLAAKATEAALKDKTIADLKASVAVQNQAVDQMLKKGQDQAARLDAAVKKVNGMKPSTQVTIHEIYTDKAKSAQQLLLDALSD